MNITPKTRLRSLLAHGYFRDVLDAFDIPYERSWTLANACRAASADIDEVILELELAESEADEEDEFEDDDDALEWAYAG